MSDQPTLDYGRMMQRALRHLMVEALGTVAEFGLPGEHHFYITFDPRHPGVDIPSWLRAEHPEELTIVIQHEYTDLAVLGDRFQIGLSFSDRPALLVVPFDSVQAFIDPSVKFGLKFDDHEDDEDFGAGPETALRGDAGEDTGDSDGDAADKPGGSAEVVSLDSFRKT